MTDKIFKRYLFVFGSSFLRIRNIFFFLIRPSANCLNPIIK